MQHFPIQRIKHHLHAISPKVHDICRSNISPRLILFKNLRIQHNRNSQPSQTLNYSPPKSKPLAAHASTTFSLHSLCVISVILTWLFRNPNFLIRIHIDRPGLAQYRSVPTRRFLYPLTRYFQQRNRSIHRLPSHVHLTTIPYIDPPISTLLPYGSLDRQYTATKPNCVPSRSR